MEKVVGRRRSDRRHERSCKATQGAGVLFVALEGLINRLGGRALKLSGQVGQLARATERNDHGANKGRFSAALVDNLDHKVAFGRFKQREHPFVLSDGARMERRVVLEDPSKSILHTLTGAFEGSLLTFAALLFRPYFGVPQRFALGAGGFCVQSADLIFAWPRDLEGKVDRASVSSIGSDVSRFEGSTSKAPSQGKSLHNKHSRPH